MSAGKPFKILCVDDENGILDILSSVISELGFEPVLANSAAKALSLLPGICSDTALVLSDYNMPDMDGFAFRKAFPDECKSIPFVIVSGCISRDDALQALDLKISGFAEKPFTAKSIQDVIAKHTPDRIASLMEERDLIQGFISDAESLIEEMETLLLSLESNPSDMEIINRVFAIAHTIKGASGFFNPKTIHQFTHKFEDYLSFYKKNATPVPPQAVSVLLSGVDIIKNLLNTLKCGQTIAVDLSELLKIFEKHSDSIHSAGQEESSNNGTTGTSKKALQKDEIRVSISTLDQFMELSGEITVIRNMINKLVRSIETEMPGNRDITLLSELLDEMHRINSQLQDRVVDLRKVSVKNIFRPLHRALRDLSSHLKKEIEFTTSGEDIRVDTSIADILNNSLIHMVRNCADHGIETGDVRRTTGKEPKGHIFLDVKEQNQEIVVTIKDDGRGIDTEVIRRKIVEKGLYTEESASKMSVKELQAVIFESGFSTSAGVTDVSGRGVGMDMVRNAVTSCGGRIEIQSEIGKGTVFQLIIPIPKTVTIITSLLVDCGTQTFAVPQSHLERVLSIADHEKQKYLRTSGGSDFLVLDRELVPAVNLRAVLSNDQRHIHRVPPDTSDLKIAVIRSEAGSFAMLIDKICDTEDTVVKKLGRHLEQVRIFHGATFLGDGKVGLILDVDGLARFAGIGKKNHGKPVATRETMIQKKPETLRNLLTFEFHQGGLFGIFLDDLFRLEEFTFRDIHCSGQLPVTIYRNAVIPVMNAAELLNYGQVDAAPSGTETIPTMILHQQNRFFGLSIKRIVDLHQTEIAPDPQLKDRKGIAGALIHGERTITVLDSNEIMELIECRQKCQPKAS